MPYVVTMVWNTSAPSRRHGPANAASASNSFSPDNRNRMPMSNSITAPFAPRLSRMGRGRCYVIRAIYPFEAMRKTDVTQHAMFSYRSLEEHIPAGHPLRKMRVLGLEVQAYLKVGNALASRIATGVERF